MVKNLIPYLKELSCEGKSLALVCLISNLTLSQVFFELSIKINEV